MFIIYRVYKGDANTDSNIINSIYVLYNINIFLYVIFYFCWQKNIRWCIKYYILEAKVIYGNTTSLIIIKVQTLFCFTLGMLAE